MAGIAEEIAEKAWLFRDDVIVAINEALERAALLADDYGTNDGDEIAAAIRKLRGSK